MAQFRVGCVPYVNARPLVAAFDHPNPYIEVLYDVPSKLPSLLDSGEVDAILVSSIELLRRDDLLPVAEVGIMSNGPVKSVRLLSKVPLLNIESLALDQSSLTSNMLAQVILAEHGVFPSIENQTPSPSDMLDSHDACVIIGDKGFEADGTDLVDIDLGAAWTELTGLPFVWALWLGKRDRSLNHTDLASLLHSAYIASGFCVLHDPENNKSTELDQIARRKVVIQSAVDRSNWTFEQVENYLTKNVRFDHARAQESLTEFVLRINKHGLGPVMLPIDLQLEVILESEDNFKPEQSPT